MRSVYLRLGRLCLWVGVAVVVGSAGGPVARAVLVLDLPVRSHWELAMRVVSGLWRVGQVGAALGGGSGPGPLAVLALVFRMRALL